MVLAIVGQMYVSWRKHHISTHMC